MDFRASLIIRNIVGNDVTGALAMDSGRFSHWYPPEEEWATLLISKEFSSIRYNIYNIEYVKEQIAR